MLVRVVAKKKRLGLRISSGDALRPGRAMQGLKPAPFLCLLRHDSSRALLQNSLKWAFFPILKSCPVTKRWSASGLQADVDHFRVNDVAFGRFVVKSDA